MNKKKLLELIAKKEARKAELGKTAEKTEDVKELRSINVELEALNGEIAELRGIVDGMPDDEPEGDPQQRGQDPDVRGAQPKGDLNVLGTYGVGGKGKQERRTADEYDTPEYRAAFMDYVTKGLVSEALEMRANATTKTTDIGAVIPTTILNKIVEKMVDFGHIWARVTKTSIPGGVEIPIASAKPTATWVTEAVLSDKQKKTVSGNISFSYHKLQCRVAVTLMADTVALPVFEQTVTDNVYEAMVVALETAIISGSGTGQPLGITEDTDIPTAQKVNVKVSEMARYDKWTELFAKVPRKYRNGAVLILADADWNKYIVGMVDANGQPVARTTYGIDGTQQERFLGKEVIPVEDYLTSIDDASTGDIFGIICKLSDYMVNSNMQMTFKRYFWEETDEWISKSTIIADGKLADRNGVVLLKKAAE